MEKVTFCGKLSQKEKKNLAVKSFYFHLYLPFLRDVDLKKEKRVEECVYTLSASCLFKVFINGRGVLKRGARCVLLSSCQGSWSCEIMQRQRQEAIFTSSFQLH